MNRIILIGNGFDLAHKLPTRYEDFLNWYWEQRVNGFNGNFSDTDEDCLCSFKIKDNSSWGVWDAFNNCQNKPIIDLIIKNHRDFETTFSPFLKNICNSIETKGWVDIENEYYQLLKKCSKDSDSCGFTTKELNQQLHYLQDKLAEYLIGLTTDNIEPNEDIKKIIYDPFNINDISVAGKSCIAEHCSYWLRQYEQKWKSRLYKYGIDDSFFKETLSDFKRKHTSGGTIVRNYDLCPREVLLPDSVLLLNFNYSEVADKYIMDSVGFMNHIHGELSKPRNIIFGYGDELDEAYSDLIKLNDNECLQNIKSIKYLESSNYRNMLSFIESAPYQIYIMGHSCGNSDRTLLNTLFEHKNCVSIKPFYYKKDDGTDNYLEIVQNICRNFTDMKLMRDKVVNKTYCEPLPQSK